MRYFLFAIVLFLSNASFAYDSSCDFITGSEPISFSQECQKQAAQTLFVFERVGNTQPSSTDKIDYLVKATFLDASDNAYVKAAIAAMSKALLVLSLGFAVLKAGHEIWKASHHGDFLGSAKGHFFKSLASKMLLRILAVYSSVAALLFLLTASLGLMISVAIVFQSILVESTTHDDVAIRSQVHAEAERIVDMNFQKLLMMSSVALQQAKENIWRETRYDPESGKPYQFDPSDSDYYACVRQGGEVWDDDASSYTMLFMRRIKLCAEKHLDWATQNAGLVRFQDETGKEVRTAVVAAESQLMSLASFVHRRACAGSNADLKFDEIAFARVCMSYSVTSNEVTLSGGRFVIDNQAVSSAALANQAEAIKSQLVTALYEAGMQKVNAYSYEKVRNTPLSLVSILLNESKWRADIRESAFAGMRFEALVNNERQGHSLEEGFTESDEFGEDQKKRAAEQYMRVDEIVADVAPTSRKTFIDSIESFANSITNNFFKNAGYSSRGCLENQCSAREFNQISNLYNASDSLMRIGFGGYVAMKSSEAIFKAFGSESDKPDAEATSLQSMSGFLANIALGLIVLGLIGKLGLIFQLLSHFIVGLINWFMSSIAVALLFTILLMKQDENDKSESNVPKAFLLILFKFVEPALLVVTLVLALVLSYALTGIFNDLFYYFMTQNGMLSVADGFSLINILLSVFNLVVYFALTFVILKLAIDSSTQFSRAVAEALFSNDSRLENATSSVSQKAKDSLDKIAEGGKSK